MRWAAGRQNRYVTCGSKDRFRDASLFAARRRPGLLGSAHGRPVCAGVYGSPQSLQRTGISHRSSSQPSVHVRVPAPAPLGQVRPTVCGSATLRRMRFCTAAAMAMNPNVCKPCVRSGLWERVGRSVPAHQLKPWTFQGSGNIQGSGCGSSEQPSLGLRKGRHDLRGVTGRCHGFAAQRHSPGRPGLHARRGRWAE